MIQRISDDEKGIGHLIVVVVIVVVVAAIAFVGYTVASNNKTTPYSSNNKNSSSSSKSATSSSSINSSCLAVYHDANLCHFESNSQSFEKTAYVATLTDVNKGTTSNMTLSSDGKGNTSLVLTSNGEQLSTISLDGNTYIQSGTGTTWIEYPAGTAGSPSVSSNPTSDMNIGVGSTGITYKAEGTAPCGSLTCYKYEVMDSAQPGTVQYAWFDTSQYKLREWQATDSTNGTITMNISYPMVSIKAPSPVQQYGQS